MLAEDLVAISDFDDGDCKEIAGTRKSLEKLRMEISGKVSSCKTGKVLTLDVALGFNSPGNEVGIKERKLGKTVLTRIRNMVQNSVGGSEQG